MGAPPRLTFFRKKSETLIHLDLLSFLTGLGFAPWTLMGNGTEFLEKHTTR